MPKFNPTGTLNVAIDASDIRDGDFVRCKNLRIDEQGKARTRDGSTKLNASAINTAMWLIEEMDGNRYTFSGTNIYHNESSIASGVTSAQWASVKYNAFNDTNNNIFALNGTDRKRVEGGVVYEWGLAAPTVAPTLGVGGGTGLTGQYNAKYTYVRKVSGAIVAESNPSPAADTAQVLTNGSLSISATQPSDSQVTHIRFYRTLAGGEIYYLDAEVTIGITLAYGYSHDWESDDGYLAGTGYLFTYNDTIHGTDNCYTWEELFEDREDTDPDDDPTSPNEFVLPWKRMDIPDAY